MKLNEQFLNRHNLNFSNNILCQVFKHDKLVLEIKRK